MSISTIPAAAPSPSSASLLSGATAACDDTLTDGELHGVVRTFIVSKAVKAALTGWTQIVRTALAAQGFEFVRELGEGISLEDGFWKRVSRQLWRDPALEVDMVLETDMTAYAAQQTVGRTYLSAKLTGTLADLVDPQASAVKWSEYLTARRPLGGRAEVALAELHRGLAYGLQSEPLHLRQRTVRAFVQEVLQRQCH